MLLNIYLFIVNFINVCYLNLRNSILIKNISFNLEYKEGEDTVLVSIFFIRVH